MGKVVTFSEKKNRKFTYDIFFNRNNFYPTFEMIQLADIFYLLMS